MYDNECVYKRYKKKSTSFVLYKLVRVLIYDMCISATNFLNNRRRNSSSRFYVFTIEDISEQQRTLGLVLDQQNKFSDEK